MPELTLAGHTRATRRFGAIAKLLVVIVGLMGCTESHETLDVASGESALCTGVTFSVSPATMPITGLVTLTGTSSCAGGETAQYKFAFHQEGANGNNFTQI